ncbi:MAG: dihydropteroate synthase [Phycisphaerae bacterium]
MSTAPRCANDPTILGILNLTSDSFSDGGKFLDVAAALTHAEALVRGGADAIDVGAQASNPTAIEVSVDEEVARLTPVVTALKRRDVAVSVDTFRPAVMRAMLALGADYINDICGFVDADAIPAVRDANTKLIVMHAVHTSRRGAGDFVAARAEPLDSDVATIVARVEGWLRMRVNELLANGIHRDRLILDPGMGFFLGREPLLSVEVLRQLPRLAAIGLPLLVSVSRKSFVGALLADDDANVPPPHERSIGTLAAEAFAVARGATYVRTHEPAALREFLRVQRALDDKK